MENSRVTNSHIDTSHQGVQLKSESEIRFGKRMDLTHKGKGHYLS